MTTTANKRPMTLKRFVSAKLSGKTTAEGFLSAHWQFLKGQEFLSPILDSYESKELLPTPTVQLCQSAILDHLLEYETQKGAKKAQVSGSGTKIIRRNKGKVPTTGKYEIKLMCKFYSRDNTVTVDIGQIEKIEMVEKEVDGKVITEKVTKKYPAIYHTNDFGAAQRLADRHLTERGDSVYAVISNTEGSPVVTNIQRDDAIARLMRDKKGPSTVRTSASTSTLGFGIKAKNDHARFSRG